MRILLAALCLFATSALNAQNLKEFAGTWRADPDKVHEKATPVKDPTGNAPDIPPPPGTTAVYTIDPSGQEVSDPIPDAPGSLRVASTCWDSRKLVTEWKMQRNGETFMHSTDVHSLTSDGQLVVSRTIESPRHHADVRLDLKRVPE
ncbi:MAG: hypothetical protein DMG74_20685 [Acidobacteria bacterium]|nr:MAG: hypothetical protein DMG74_20685 [Acidobacteriota bacterium]